MSDCPFCRAAMGDVDTHVIADDGQTFVLRPLNPVTNGHLLIIPRRHLERAVDADGSEMKSILRHVQVIMWGTRDGYNLICNQGETASQTVEHLHWHLVPRREGDGLMLPWTNQEDVR